MPTPAHHQALMTDNIHSFVAFVVTLLASWAAGAFAEINANLPFILQWLALAVAVTTIARNLVALWMRRP